MNSPKSLSYSNNHTSMTSIKLIPKDVNTSNHWANLDNCIYYSSCQNKLYLWLTITWFDRYLCALRKSLEQNWFQTRAELVQIVLCGLLNWENMDKLQLPFCASCHVLSSPKELHFLIVQFCPLKVWKFSHFSILVQNFKVIWGQISGAVQQQLANFAFFRLKILIYLSENNSLKVDTFQWMLDDSS